MKISDIKLGAKKSMVDNYFKCFVVGILPFVTFSLLTLLNYCLLIVLKKTDFSFNGYITPYAGYIRPILMSTGIIISFIIFCYIRLFTDGYFFLKSFNKKITFKKVRKFISLRQCVTYSVTVVLKFLLSISWATLYFSPCCFMFGLLVYSYRNWNYGFNINLTLFVSSVMLFMIGLLFFFITLKRYALCSYLILKKKMKNPFKLIENSISHMERHSIRYSLCCFSFSGWILSCVTIVPVTYVLPYIILSKWHYFNSMHQSENVIREDEKPIIFYIQKRLEN